MSPLKTEIRYYKCDMRPYLVFITHTTSHLNPEMLHVRLVGACSYVAILFATQDVCSMVKVDFCRPISSSCSTSSKCSI